MSKRGEKSKTRNIASNIILVCLIAIFVISAYNVGKILYNYYKDRSSYSKITDMAGADEFTGDIDFAKLKEVNPEIIGWIYLKDSKINYPIVQGQDNDKYLHTLYDGTYGGAGAIFADSETQAPFRQFNTVIYGHHMKDGSMFNNLKEFKNPDYEKSHSQFEIITPERKYHLYVIAFCNPKFDSDLHRPNITSDGGKQDYISLINNEALYTTDVKYGTGDKLVLLSTCAYEYEGARYVVVGKLVPWKED